jgi:hypothetical protein
MTLGIMKVMKAQLGEALPECRLGGSAVHQLAAKEVTASWCALPPRLCSVWCVQHVVGQA